MQLTLSIRAGDGVPQHNAELKSFDQFPVIIGRSASCDFVLNDQSRYISANHAAVSEDNGTLYIEDTSSNGVYVNGSNEPIGRGQMTQLNDGDKIAIGEYSLEARVSVNVVDVNDPFAFAQDEKPEAHDYNPFESSDLDWTPKSEKHNEWMSSSSAGSPKEHEKEQPDGGWANWTGLNDSDEEKQVKPDTPQRRKESDENVPWFNAEKNNNDAQRVQGRPSRDENITKRNQEPIPAYNRQKPVRRSAPNNRSLAPVQPHSPSNADDLTERALKAFFEAAQLKQKHFADQSPEAIMAQTGKLLNLAIDGMMALLQSRAEIKNAIRSDVTQLNRVDNNPLKFSYSPQDALKKLLSEDTGGGYLDSERAMTQAIDDLKVHQVALLEGMKSAVNAMLSDFNPDKLAAAMEKKHPIAVNIPITRDAKLWQLYQEHYSDIKEEAVNNFGEMFGIEFRRAYEQRIKDRNKSN